MSRPKESQVLKISLNDINGCKTYIGKGGYGRVYQGELLVNGENTKVAVKRLHRKHGQGLKQFWKEVQLLSREQHQNLISLVGYCDEGDEKTIVYKYAEGGSLDTYITRKIKPGKTLSWVERLKICTDAARGLDHLHNHVGRRLMIIHRDIKSSNILIDGNRGAKISDLGLSKLNATGDGMSLVVSHYCCGTKGYSEPEYLKTGILTKKTDVYSFGIVLFEVLCGRLCLVDYNDGEPVLISDLVKKHKDSLAKIIHPSLSQHMGSYSMTKFSEIAYRCLNEDREQRPDMDVVKNELEEALELEETGLKELQHLKIPFEAIEVATEHFKICIGRSLYGLVYKGVLSINGKSTEVAVRLNEKQHEQGSKQFWEEVQLLSRVVHPNLISLVGYCDEGKEKTIVYEYADRGSLDTYISKRNRIEYNLSWLQRLKICTDAARGLDHLHNHAIIHRDIKSSNILIYEKWDAKISGLEISTDFGGSQVVSDVCGTVGYCEQEYLQTGILTEKCDVFSFGIVLFEVLCGKLCLVDYNDGFILSSESIKERKDNLAKIIHPSLSQHIGSYSMTKFSEIAYRCLNEDRKQRPGMDVVKKELEELLKFEEMNVELSPLSGPDEMNDESPKLNVMNIVLVAAECNPWSKTGDLGDFAGALPKALARLGHRVMVVVPLYENYTGLQETEVTKWYIVNEEYMEVHYFQAYIDGVDFVFIQNPIFENLGSNIYGGSRQDILRRMVLFCKAAIEAPWHVLCGGSFYSDENLVFIANDWHTALLSVYLKAYYHEHGYMIYARSVLVIHNTDHQGRFRLNENFYVDLPQDYLDKFKTNDPVDGDHYNILAAGLKTAHGIVTVLSHGYAQELKNHEGGQGLNGIISKNDWKSKGTCIVNGIDKNEWSTEVDLSWENVANQYQDVLFDAKKKK